MNSAADDRRLSFFSLTRGRQCRDGRLMATEDFYTFSEKLLRKNPEIWYGVAAVAGWVLLLHFYRLLRAEPAARKAMLKSYGGMALFLLLFALAALGFAAAFTFLPGR